MNRKDMGNLPSEVVPPTRTGKKAVVELELRVLVEVNESDDFSDMANQAKDILNQRIVEAKTFYPFSSSAKTLHTNTTVDKMKQTIFVDWRCLW